MHLRTLALAAAVCSAGALAHADVVTTYTVENQAGSANYGTVTIDSTTGLVESTALSVPINGVDVSFSGAPASQGFYPYLDDYRATLTTTGFELLFSLPVTSLAGYDPADRKACATNKVDCDYTLNEFDGPISSADLAATVEGNLVAVPASNTNVTPEPGSLLLVATGMLGVAGTVRRRLA